MIVLNYLTLHDASIFSVSYASKIKIISFVFSCSESYTDNTVTDEQSIKMKTYVVEQENNFVENEVVKQERGGMNNMNADVPLDHHMRNLIEDRMKQNDIIKEAGSVILSTCYDTTMPGDTVVESYEETVNCASPPFIHASDTDENHAESDHDETVTVMINDQHAMIEDEIGHQPPIKKSKLWEERDSM